MRWAYKAVIIWTLETSNWTVQVRVISLIIVITKLIFFNAFYWNTSLILESCHSRSTDTTRITVSNSMLWTHGNTSIYMYVHVLWTWPIFKQLVSNSCIKSSDIIIRSSIFRWVNPLAITFTCWADCQYLIRKAVI